MIGRRRFGTNGPIREPQPTGILKYRDACFRELELHMVNTILSIPSDITGGTYFGWGSFQIQSGNLIVIIVMLVLFVLALVLPFPGNKRSK